MSIFPKGREENFISWSRERKRGKTDTVIYSAYMYHISHIPPHEKIYVVLNLYIKFIYIYIHLLVELYISSASYTSREIFEILCNDQFSPNISCIVRSAIKTWNLS